MNRSVVRGGVAVLAAIGVLAVAGPAQAAPNSASNPGSSPGSNPVPTLASNAAPIAIAPGSVIRVSQDQAGDAPDWFSQPYSISADGRYVVWASRSAYVVAGDTNGQNDVFVYDVKAATTRLVSHTEAGAASNGDSPVGQISSNGRFVFFTSTATDLPDAAGAAADGYLLYAYSVATGRVRLVSQVDGVAVRGVVSSLRDGFKVSATGRFVAFWTLAAIDAADTNGRADAYRFDTVTGELRWVSAGYRESDGDVVGIGAVSGAGSVVYDSSASTIVPVPGLANDQLNVYLWNPRTGNTLVSRSPAGQPANASAYTADLSDDAATVTFTSTAGNLVTESGPVSDTGQQFVYRVATGRVVRISRNFSGLPEGMLHAYGTISPSGRHIAYLAYVDPSLGLDSYILRYDTVTRRTTQILRSPEAIPAGISNDGRRILLHSPDATLAPGTDTNNDYDAFLWTQRT